jgi:hypothetical protein
LITSLWYNLFVQSFHWSRSVQSIISPTRAPTVCVFSPLSYLPLLQRLPCT